MKERWRCISLLEVSLLAVTSEDVMLDVYVVAYMSLLVEIQTAKEDARKQSKRIQWDFMWRTKKAERNACEYL